MESTDWQTGENIMPRVDINGKIVDFPDNLTPDQLQQAVASAAQQMKSVESTSPNEKSILRSGAEKFIKSPALPIIGGTIGAVGGAGLMSIPFAGLGAAAGESYRQLGARKLGLPVPKTSLEAAKTIGGEALSGAAGQGLTMGASAVARPIVKPIGNAIASGAEKLIGLPAKAVSSVFKKPLSIITAPTKKKVSEAYLKSEFPQMAEAAVKSVDDVIEAANSSYGKTVKNGAKELKEFYEKKMGDPLKIIKGRKALDKQIALLENQIKLAKDAGKSALEDAKSAKLALRKMFNEALDKMVPKFREADALASARFDVEPFRRLTLPGKMNFTSPEGIMRAVPGLPIAAGGAISAAGGAAKGISKSLPVAGQIVGQAISPSIIEKIPTTEKLKQYLKEVKKKNPGISDEEAKNKVREMARRDGYSLKKK